MTQQQIAFILAQAKKMVEKAKEGINVHRYYVSPKPADIIRHLLKRGQKLLPMTKALKAMEKYSYPGDALKSLFRDRAYEDAERVLVEDARAKHEARSANRNKALLEMDESLVKLKASLLFSDAVSLKEVGSVLSKFEKSLQDIAKGV